MTLHEKLLDLAERLKASGQDDDAATVWSAAFATAPGPKPTMESTSQPVPGLIHHWRYYGR